MIGIQDLGKAYGGQTLFRGATIQFQRGCRYGVVGANGSGKSTLLSILAGDEEPSEGEVSIPRRARVGVLRQDHFRYETTPILDVVMAGHPELWRAFQEKEKLLSAPAEAFDVDRLGELEETIQQCDGYAFEARAAEILEGLNIPARVHREPLSVLSGGYKLRVLMAQTLAADPDVLLLDEPTNHLDILSIRWLEKFLCEFAGVVLVVSHDHQFLDNVATHIVDVDYQRLTLYKGNYTAFVREKVAERERREAEIARREKEIAEQKASIERFKAKPTKARQALSKQKLIERVELEPLPPSSRRYPTFRFQARRPSGKVVLEMRHVSKSYADQRVLDDVSLVVQRGDRLAVIGPNGIGKSTLLKIAMGRLAPDAGEVEWGYEADPGYFPQDHHEVIGPPEATVEGWLWDFCPGEPVGFVRSRLAQVLFERDEVDKKLSSLSGGEAARLLFASLGVRRPTVLVLDEPTNHLDLEGIEALADGLEAYDGTIVFVSHDRWFVRRLANRILELTPEGITDFRGSYDDYLAHCGDDHLDVEAVAQREQQRRRERRRARRARGG